MPDHLQTALWGWIVGGFQGDYEVYDERVHEVGIHLRIRILGNSWSQRIDYLGTMSRDPEFMLDLVEALLELYGWDMSRAESLDELLEVANSAYTVKKSWDGLEERVAPGVKDAVQGALDATGGSAGDHLTDAWNEAYGRQHDPVKSFSESIKAVESALAQHVSPQNGRQTLGTMIRDVSTKPEKWEFEIADGGVGGVETVYHMMRMLWDGQTSRHGGVQPTRPETIEEARAAVHMAATLVQWGVSGAFRAR